MHTEQPTEVSVPWFGARKLVRTLLAQLGSVESERDGLRAQLDRLGVLSVIELETRKKELERALDEQQAQMARRREAERTEIEGLKKQLADARKSIVETEDLALLQEAGIYHYRHPLTDAVAYEKELETIDFQIKAMTRKDGGAVLAATNWTVNGSAAEGRTMVRDFSKLMLRAFNAEADNLVRGLKPYKLDAAVERLKKVASTIEKLGKTMQIRISTPYLNLRVRELELTADFLQKQAEQKEATALLKRLGLAAAGGKA